VVAHREQNYKMPKIDPKGIMDREHSPSLQELLREWRLNRWGMLPISKAAIMAKREIQIGTSKCAILR
jgi:hypothetical protein